MHMQYDVCSKILSHLPAALGSSSDPLPQPACHVVQTQTAGEGPCITGSLLAFMTHTSRHAASITHLGLHHHLLGLGSKAQRVARVLKLGLVGADCADDGHVRVAAQGRLQVVGQLGVSV